MKKKKASKRGASEVQAAIDELVNAGLLKKVGNGKYQISGSDKVDRYYATPSAVRRPQDDEVTEALIESVFPKGGAQ